MKSRLTELVTPKLTCETFKKELFEQFKSGEPFPHVVIDNFFEPNFFKVLSKSMNDLSARRLGVGKTYSSDVEKNKWGSSKSDLPEELKLVKTAFSSPEFILTIEAITGLRELVVTKDINGEGFSFFHISGPGSYLGPHLDHTRDRVSGGGGGGWKFFFNNGPYHVANIIVYSSERWELGYGGGTQLYNSPQKVAKTIEYRPNRALVFLHSPISIHGTERTTAMAPQRYSLYFDFYSTAANPFDGVLMRSVSLHGSPHRFYLPKFIDYFKPRNFRYSGQHLRGFL